MIIIYWFQCRKIEEVSIRYLRKISLNKEGTEPRGEDIFKSEVPCQYRVAYRTNAFCENPNIFVLNDKKEPV